MVADSVKVAFDSPWSIRSAMWRTQGWHKPINLDAAAHAVAQELVAQVVVDLMGKGHVLTDFDRVSARIEARMREILDRAVTNLEAEGFVIPNLEGSVERAMAGLMGQFGSLEGTTDE